MISLRAQGGLNSLNFFVGAIQTAFGLFYTDFLARLGWSPADIGYVLSIGTAAALVFQLPAGWMVDSIHFKRFALAIAFVLVAVSAIMVITATGFLSEAVAQVLHAFASCLITPAIAALTLTLCGHDLFSERLGSNGRYASLGNAVAALVLGAAAAYFTGRSVFILTALLLFPALATLLFFRARDRVEDEHPALLHPRERKQRDARPWHIFHDPILHLFAICVVLFQFANAGILPLAMIELTKRTGQSGFVVTAVIIVPQVVVILCSPWVGRLAQSLGRRPILLVGFTALPLRALLFATQPDAVPLIVMETLDGVSATVFGLALPLIAADVTKQTGYLNLAIGALGLASGLGATASTTVAGWLAGQLGAPAAFVCLAAVGLAAVAVLWKLMPETRPGRPPITGQPGVVAA